MFLLCYNVHSDETFHFHGKIQTTGCSQGGEITGCSSGGEKAQGSTLGQEVHNSK